MKKNKLEKLKKLSKNDLKNIAGGQGGCTAGHFEYVDFDPTIRNADGTLGNGTYQWVKGTC